MTRLLLFISALAFVFLQAPQLQAQGMEDATGAANSSSADSAAKEVPRSDPAWQYATALLNGVDTFYRYDSTFFPVHRYHRMIARARPFVDLGTAGTPQRVLLYNPHITQGFYSGLNPHPVYNKTPDSLKFYKARVPLTRFQYTQGGNQAIILDAQHTQNFSPTWNISFDFSSTQNGQIYTSSKQNNLHRGTMAGSNFLNKKGNYQNTLILSWNRGRRSENRGIMGDSAFFIASPDRIRIVGNYVPASNTASSFFAQRHHVLEQKIFNGEKKMYLFHRFDWVKEKYEYSEISGNRTASDSAFYGNDHIYTDSAFHDSTVYVQWNNQSGLGAKKLGPNANIFWKAWYSLDRIAYNSIYKTSANIYFNHGIHTWIGKENNLNEALRWHADAHYYLQGNNAGDYLVQAFSQYALTPKIRIVAHGISQKFQAPFISEKFSGNYIHYFQKRQASVANSFSFGSYIRTSNINIDGMIKAGTATNMVYTDTLSKFQQIPNIRFIQFQANIQLRFGKFHFDNRITLQQHNRQTAIPVPVFSDLASLYFQNYIFKAKSMLARIGVDLWYTSEYNGYRYQPMNGTFYPGKIKSGNYPYLDFYFSGEVKTVMLYIKLEHFNNYLDNYGFNSEYTSALVYPAEPLRLRFGFVWRFYN